MKRLKTPQGFLAVVAVLAVIASAVLALGFQYQTPAEIQAEHIAEFEEHRDHAEPILDFQMRLSCMEVSADTLALMGATALCVQLGVPRSEP